MKTEQLLTTFPISQADNQQKQYLEDRCECEGILFMLIQMKVSGASPMEMYVIAGRFKTGNLQNR